MRKIVIILLCCTVLLLLGYSGYLAYQNWKQTHWMSLAKEYAAKGDEKNVALCLEQAIRLNPRNLEACRMMANLAEISGDPSAIALRKRVLELDPNSMNDQLALAQTAVIAHDYNTAATALAAVDAMGKKPAVYFNIMGQLDLATGKIAEAESNFAEAIRLDPSNTAPQLSLAVVQLHGTNTLDMAEARITLRRISMNSTNVGIRAEADRELVLDAIRYKDNDTALWFSKQLAQPADANFLDKLLRLQVLKAVHSDEYKSALVANEHEAATNSTDLSKLTLWFLDNEMPAQALAWIRTLPANTQTNPPAVLLAAQCQLLVQDWQGLRDSLSKENFGERDFVRHAFIARAMREQGLYEASKAEWQAALKSCNGQANALEFLLHYAALWNWQDETEQILWNLVNDFPQERWAGDQLANLLYTTGSTRALMQLYSIEANRHPSDLDAKNNLALTAMLVHAQEMNPFDIASEIYQKAPTNSFYATTYAFSLHLQQKNAEALKIMQQVPPQSLKNYSTAGYYGLILKAAGDNARAANYLKYALQGKLLPEEHTLFERAMAGS